MTPGRPASPTEGTRDDCAPRAVLRQVPGRNAYSCRRCTHHRADSEVAAVNVLGIPLFGFFTVMAGATVSSKHPGILPGLWFVFLGVVIAVLVGMLFLVISETLVPSGSLPGPLHVMRGTRQLATRARRYWQI